MHTYTLGQVEAAVAAAHGIREEGLPAFKARLRHLRNLGVPMIPHVGSGSRVNYSEDNVRQLFLALEFEQFGMSPRLAARFVREIWSSPFLRHIKEMFEVAEASENDPLYLVFHPFFIGEAFGKEKKDEIILVGLTPQIYRRPDLFDKILTKQKPDPKRDALQDRLYDRLGVPREEQLRDPRRLLVLNLTDGLALLKGKLAATTPKKRGSA